MIATIVRGRKWRTKSIQETKKCTCGKNNYYKELTPNNILPGVLEKLKLLEDNGIMIAIGSSSKNTPIILKQIGMDKFFNAVSDRNNITHSKPNPEVFLKDVEMLGVDPQYCMTVEDADTGIEAGKRAGMKTLAVHGASGSDYSVENLADILKMKVKGKPGQKLAFQFLICD